MGSLLVFGCWLHFVSNIVFFFCLFCFFWFFVFLVYWFFVFLVFPLNWDRLGSHKIDQKRAQNLNLERFLPEITVKHSVFASFFA